jgi:hypothetical protein
MPIAAAELLMYRSLVINDGGTNGGRMSNAEVVSAAASNLLPVTSQADRTAGTLKYRKAFWKVANDADLKLFNPKLFVDQQTIGDDVITFFAATQIDTQATIAGTENKYGAGNLNASVLAAVSSIAVLVEDPATIIFRNGEMLRISDKADVDAAGNEEFIVISGVPTIVGNVVTIALATPLQNGYSNANTRVASVYTPADVQASIDNFVCTTAGSGDYNPASLTFDAIGGIEQTWTLTFTDATHFNIVGDTVGSVGTGTIGAGAAPNNAAFTKPYFVLAAGGFSGVFAAADTIVFQTHPATVPIWVKRVVPAGSAASANNKAIVALKGETS